MCFFGTELLRDWVGQKTNLEENEAPTPSYLDRVMFHALLCISSISLGNVPIKDLPQGSNTCGCVDWSVLPCELCSDERQHGEE